MTGTFINVASVVAGGTTGVLLGSRLPEKVQQTLINGVGMMTLALGIQMALKMQNPVTVLISMLLGGVIGEGTGLASGLDALGDLLQRRLSGTRGRVSEAFVTTSLIFCVGPMTILGSIQDGLSGRYQLLAIKSTLDGITALAFGSTLGPGVLLSSLTILVYQGALTLGASAARDLLTEAMVTEMTAVGGLIIIGLGLEILQLKQLRVANFLPALLVAPAAQAVQTLVSVHVS